MLVRAASGHPARQPVLSHVGSCKSGLGRDTPRTCADIRSAERCSRPALRSPSDRVVHSGGGIRGTGLLHVVHAVALRGAAQRVQRRSGRFLEDVGGGLRSLVGALRHAQPRYSVHRERWSGSAHSQEHRSACTGAEDPRAGASTSTALSASPRPRCASTCVRPRPAPAVDHPGRRLVASPGDGGSRPRTEHVERAPTISPDRHRMQRARRDEARAQWMCEPPFTSYVAPVMYPDSSRHR